MKGDPQSRRARRRQEREDRQQQALTDQAEFYRHAYDQTGKYPASQWKVILIFSLIFNLGILASYSAANGIMWLIYRTWFPDVGHPLVRQYLTVILMLILIGTTLTLIRLLFDPGRHQITTFMLMMDGMRRLAKGDFNVKIEADPRHSGRFGFLFKSFNEMATGLGQMEKMRQEFISNVSHEFQSPLTSIGGFARALQSDELPPETRRHYLRIIEMEVARLSKLSENLLKLTSLESNHHPFEPKLYRLDRQLRRIILSCEPQWQDKKLEMDIDLPQVTVTADEDLLNQVWINLVHNAIKFSTEGGTLRVVLEERDGRICVEVSDNGIGVSQEDLPHLFDRFYKADKARNRTGGGSGLGLSIVRKIVEMHDGVVAVDSRPGEGASFIVTLPQGAETKPASKI